MASIKHNISFKEIFDELDNLTVKYSGHELSDICRKVSTSYDKRINNFYIRFPNAPVDHPSAYGLTDRDVVSYYVDEFNRVEQCYARLRDFTKVLELAQVPKIKSILFQVLKCAAIFWIILIICAAFSTDNIGQALGLIAFLGVFPFFAFLVLLLLSYWLLGICSFLYNRTILNKFEKEEDWYSRFNSTAQLIQVIETKQADYLSEIDKIPLPRIEINHLNKQIDESEITAEVAKELLAFSNGEVFRRGVRYKDVSTEDKLLEDIDNIIKSYHPSAIALNKIGISQEMWRDMALDILCIGFICGAFRGYNCEMALYKRYREWYLSTSEKKSRDERCGLIYALKHFQVDNNDWIQKGAFILGQYRITYRNPLKEYGYVPDLYYYCSEDYSNFIKSL